VRGSAECPAILASPRHTTTKSRSKTSETCLRVAPQDVKQLLHHAEAVVQQLHAAVDLQILGHLKRR